MRRRSSASFAERQSSGALPSIAPARLASGLLPEEQEELRRQQLQQRAQLQAAQSWSLDGLPPAGQQQQRQHPQRVRASSEAVLPPPARPASAQVRPQSPAGVSSSSSSSVSASHSCDARGMHSLTKQDTHLTQPCMCPCSLHRGDPGPAVQPVSRSQSQIPEESWPGHRLRGAPELGMPSPVGSPDTAT